MAPETASPPERPYPEAASGPRIQPSATSLEPQYSCLNDQAHPPPDIYLRVDQTTAMAPETASPPERPCGRAPSRSDLPVGDPLAPPRSGGEQGGGGFPRRQVALRDQPGSFGAREETQSRALSRYPLSLRNGGGDPVSGPYPFATKTKKHPPAPLTPFGLRRKRAPPERFGTREETPTRALFWTEPN